MNEYTNTNFDIIVIGCGIAGLSAAISAQQNGSKVAILERAPREERGGNTRYTESFWRMKSEDEVSEDTEDELQNQYGKFTNQFNIGSNSNKSENTYCKKRE